MNLKEEIEEDTSENQTGFNLDLKTKNDVTLNLQMKLVDVLISKSDTQIIHQKSDLDNFLILELQKRCNVVVMDFLRKNKKEMKRNQQLGH